MLIERTIKRLLFVAFLLFATTATASIQNPIVEALKYLRIAAGHMAYPDRFVESKTVVRGISSTGWTSLFPPVPEGRRYLLVNIGAEFQSYHLIIRDSSGAAFLDLQFPDGSQRVLYWAEAGEQWTARVEGLHVPLVMTVVYTYEVYED